MTLDRLRGCLIDDASLFLALKLMHVSEAIEHRSVALLEQESFTVLVR